MEKIIMKGSLKQVLIQLRKVAKSKITKHKCIKRTRKHRRFRIMGLVRRDPPYSFEAAADYAFGEISNLAREQQATQNVQGLVINLQQETVEPTSTELQNTSEDVDIEEEGASEPKKPKEIEKILPEVENMWKMIIKSGGLGDAKVDICKRYPPTKNYRFLIPAKLIADVEQALSEDASRADCQLSSKQAQIVLGRALTYMVQADKDLNDKLVGGSTEFYTMYKKVEDGLRILNLTANLNKNEDPNEPGPSTQNFAEEGIVEEVKVNMEDEEDSEDVR